MAAYFQRGSHYAGLGLSLLVKVFRVSKKKKKKKPYFGKKNFNLNLLSLKNKCVIIN